MIESLFLRTPHWFALDVQPHNVEPSYFILFQRNVTAVVTRLVTVLPFVDAWCSRRNLEKRVRCDESGKHTTLERTFQPFLSETKFIPQSAQIRLLYWTLTIWCLWITFVITTGPLCFPLHLPSFLSPRPIQYPAEKNNKRKYREQAD